MTPHSPILPSNHPLKYTEHCRLPRTTEGRVVDRSHVGQRHRGVHQSTVSGCVHEHPTTITCSPSHIKIRTIMMLASALLSPGPRHTLPTFHRHHLLARSNIEAGPGHSSHLAAQSNPSKQPRIRLETRDNAQATHHRQPCCCSLLHWTE
jgi:hypothetical protein